MITHLVHAVERVRTSFRKLFFVPKNKEKKENNERIWFLVFFFFFCYGKTQKTQKILNSDNNNFQKTPKLCYLCF